MRDKLYLIVEGPGEVEALPVLVRRIFAEEYIDLHQFKYSVARPYIAKGKGNLTILEAEKGIERFLEYIRLEADCAAVLVLIDADEEDVKCPPQLAKNLAERAGKLGLPFPVAIVVAVCEYESWFLANLETIAPKYFEDAEARYEGNPEEECSAKGWLERHMPADAPYSPTIHQVKMSSDIDIVKTYEACRSFTRLVDALGELFKSIANGKASVTPL